ncbi:hypothetical protein KUCAC02_003690, partial [Chaenocephalus aceratus]
KRAHPGAGISSFGTHQLERVVLVIVPNGLGTFAVVFLTDIPRHHCLIPEKNLTQDWRDAIIPIEVVNGKREQSRCSRYRLDVVRNLSAQGFIPGRDVNLHRPWRRRAVWTGGATAKHLPVYSGSEFDLVCSDQWKPPFTTTACFLGFLVGSFISGQLSDRFGRKLFSSPPWQFRQLFPSVKLFPPSWTVFTILIFFNGLGQISNYVSGFVLGTEILTGDVRVIFSSMGVCLGYAIGYMILPLVAFFLRDWKSLLLAISLPGVLYIPLWWFIPESPRWLLSQGRVEEAEAIDDDPQEHLNVISLVKTQSVRSTTVILCLVWFSLSIGYYGLSLNTSRLHANPYISCFLSAAAEVPAYMSCWLALKYFPRRLSVIFILLLGGASLFLIQLVPETLSELAVALEMLGKLVITSGTSLMYAYTAELYPTVLRNTAEGVCITVSRTGSCLAPFLLQLRESFEYLPYITLGTLAVVSAFAALYLPESFGKPLPQTIQQMQKRESMKCPCITRKEHLKPVVHLESRL